MTGLPIRDYSWARQVEAACITVIHRGSEAAVFGALGVDVGSEHLADFATALGEQHVDRAVVQLWHQREHLVVLDEHAVAFGAGGTWLFPL